MLQQHPHGSDQSRKRFHTLSRAGIRKRLGDLQEDDNEDEFAVADTASSLSATPDNDHSNNSPLMSPALSFELFTPECTSTQDAFRSSPDTSQNFTCPSDAFSTVASNLSSISTSREETIAGISASFSYHSESFVECDSDEESIYDDAESLPDVDETMYLFSSDDDFFDEFNDPDDFNDSVFQAAASVSDASQSIDQPNITTDSADEQLLENSPSHLSHPEESEGVEKCSETATKSDATSSEDDDEISSGKVPREIDRIINLLRDWALKNAITLVALTDLSKTLKEVHECFKDLPSQGRTILKTDVKVKPTKCDPGEYIHIGLKKQLIFIISILLYYVEVIPLMFHIDGFPIFKKSKNALWPILMSIPTIEGMKNKVFPIGLWYGRGKPKNLSDYFKPLLDEYLRLFTGKETTIINGQEVKLEVLTMHGKPVRLEILGFASDTPARAYLLGTKGHGGFSSCFRCKIKGETIKCFKKKRSNKQGSPVESGNKRIFREIDKALRSDAEFRNRTCPEFQTRETPLLNFPGLTFTRSFPLDYMHLVCLGLVRMFVHLWMSSEAPRQLLPRQRNVINTKLEQCFPYLSSLDFPRRPRDGKLAFSWKATQARCFLLYVGMVALKGTLSKEKYLHFMQLCIGMRVFLGPSLCRKLDFRHYASELLRCFVSSTEFLYGKEFMTHNLHSLIHLIEDVDFFKDSFENFSLNDLSCFPFENFMQFFKRYTKSYARVVTQLGRRMGELFASNFWRSFYSPEPARTEVSFTKEHNHGPLPYPLKGKQYHSAIFPDFTLSVDLADSTCGLTTGQIIVIQNFIIDRKDNQKYVVGKQFRSLDSFFESPLWDSRQFDIYEVSNLSKNVNVWPASAINMKFVRLPLDDKFVVIPLLHSDLTPSSF